MSAISMVDFVNQTGDKLQAGMVKKVTNQSVFTRRLKFIPVDGFTYEYPQQISTGSIAFRAIGETYTADAGVVNPQKEPLALFGGAVQTDHQMVIKQGDIARANAIGAKVQRAGLTFDNTVINGNPANAKEFPGLKYRLQNRQLILMGTDGAALTLKKLNAMIDRVVGKNSEKVLVMNKTHRRIIKELMLAAATGSMVTDINGSLQKYDDCEIEILDEDGDDAEILPWTETCGSSNVTSSIYCIRLGSDTEGEFMQGLIGKTPKGLIDQYESGMQGTQHIDIVEMHAGITLRHGRTAARLAGIIGLSEYEGDE